MEMTQMNTRIDLALKRSGDAVIASLGQTPSRVVRALWEYLSVHSAFPHELEQMIRRDEAALESGRDQEDPRDRGVQIVSSFYDRFGLKGPEAPLDYQELRDVAAEERLREWGLL